MGRPLRTTAGGLIYHVLNRANRRAALVANADDYAAWLRVLAEAQRQHPVGIALTSKKGDQLDFERKLADAGTIYLEYGWDGATKKATVKAWPNMQAANANVQKDLLQNGKWIDVMGEGARRKDKLDG
jgi:hypothetical protein